MIDKQTIEQVVEFHGHMCPGLAMGLQAAQIALREIGPHAEDEEVVAVVETDMCAVDAIQFLTGCTFGKGNLIHRDWGKNAYSFYRRSDGRAVRIAARPDAWQLNGEHRELMANVLSAQASTDEQAHFWELHRAESQKILAVDPDRLFTVQEITGPPPRSARVRASVACARCGEATMETRIRRLDGRELCLPCFDAVLAGEQQIAPPRLATSR